MKCLNLQRSEMFQRGNDQQPENHQIFNVENQNEALNVDQISYLSPLGSNQMGSAHFLTKILFLEYFCHLVNKGQRQAGKKTSNFIGY